MRPFPLVIPVTLSEPRFEGKRGQADAEYKPRLSDPDQPDERAGGLASPVSEAVGPFGAGCCLTIAATAQTKPPRASGAGGGYQACASTQYDAAAGLWYPRQ